MPVHHASPFHPHQPAGSFSRQREKHSPATHWRTASLLSFSCQREMHPLAAHWRAVPLLSFSRQREKVPKGDEGCAGPAGGTRSGEAIEGFSRMPVHHASPFHPHQPAGSFSRQREKRSLAAHRHTVPLLSFSRQRGKHPLATHRRTVPILSFSREREKVPKGDEGLFGSPAHCHPATTECRA